MDFDAQKELLERYKKSKEQEDYNSRNSAMVQGFDAMASAPSKYEILLGSQRPQVKTQLTNPAESSADTLQRYQAIKNQEQSRQDKLSDRDESYRREEELMNRKFAQDKELAGLKAGQKNAKVSEGQKVVDREFAKEYNDWTSKGASTASSEIDKLQSVIDRLERGDVSTGGITGMFPDRMTTNSTLGARADVQSTVMNSLKAILGAQFTEKEGERIIKNTWNEAESSENNAARLKRLVGDLRAQADSKNAKSRYYEQNDSLYGYKLGGGQNQNVASDKNKEALQWAQANPNDPRAKKIIEKLGFEDERKYAR